MLAQRIDDQAFLKLIRKWLKAGILDTDGKILNPETGTPQGGVISPILANVYLHHALDLWFEQVVKKHVRGEAMMCRYADDFVCAFRYQEDAERFYRVLPKRLGKYGLEVAPEKTRVLRFSRFHPSRKRRFTFLGFELYWFPDRQGEMRVKHRTSRKKLQGACRWIKDWIRDNRHLKGKQFIKELNRRLQGHYNYYGLRGNSESLYRFYKLSSGGKFALYLTLWKPPTPSGRIFAQETYERAEADRREDTPEAGGSLWLPADGP